MVDKIKKKIKFFFKTIDFFVVKNRYLIILVILFSYSVVIPVIKKKYSKVTTIVFKKQSEHNICDTPELVKRDSTVKNNSFYGGVSGIFANTYSVFPINIYSSFEFEKEDSLYLQNTVNFLNSHFDSINFVFRIINIQNKDLPYIEELRANDYKRYYKYSDNLDLKDTLSLWVIENDATKLCKKIDNIVSCVRQNGWSNIASSLTNNIVISRFDLKNPYITCHEFGHYFGLEHTFTTKYGVELPDGSNCETAGDRICDTPADPNASDIFVSYNECELFYKGYKPMINNMMAYYKPCVKDPYKFTSQQYLRMLFVGRSLHAHNSQPYK